MPRSKVFIWCKKYHPSVQAVEIFDPVSTTWTTFPSEREYRMEAASAVINGRFHVCGGHAGDFLRPSAEVDRFDPALGTWQALPPMSQGRCKHGAAVVGARLYACGGRHSSSAEVFDAWSNVWKSAPGMRKKRCGGVAVIKDSVYIIGGEGDGLPSSSERLLPTGQWQDLPRMHVARAGFSPAVVDDHLYVCGGSWESSAERFDPEVGVWELLQSTFRRRLDTAVAVLHGQLYMCGGCNEDGAPVSSVERFDPAHNRWEPLAPLGCARHDARAVVVDGMLLICGHGDETVEWFDPVSELWQPLPDRPDTSTERHRPDRKSVV